MCDRSIYEAAFTEPYPWMLLNSLSPAQILRMRRVCEFRPQASIPSLEFAHPFYMPF